MKTEKIQVKSRQAHTPECSASVYAGRSVAIFSLLTLLFFLAACSTAPTVSKDSHGGAKTVPGIARPHNNQDGAPDGNIDLSSIPEPVPKVEPLARYGNIPRYTVFGKSYTTRTSSSGYVERGIASWYGTKFQKHRTSSGEPYDLYAITAAHKTLPLPTYVQVTNLNNGRRLIVRVNDRGPFHENRVIDLSYAAAGKLGILPTGTGLVEVRAIDPHNYRSPTLLADANPSTPALGIPEVKAVPVSMSSVSDSFKPRLGKKTKLILPITPPHLDQKIVTATPSIPIKTALAADTHIYLQLGAFSNRANAEQLRTRLLKSGNTTIQIRPGVLNQSSIYRVCLGPLKDVDQADHLTASITHLGFGSPVVVID